MLFKVGSGLTIADVYQCPYLRWNHFRAIELDGRNAVYYCNRAAAHSKMNQHELAIQDCKKAIMIDDNYSKAYGRMG